MKKLAIILSLAALAGCAAPPPGPAYYGSRAYTAPADPSQWRVVSVTPVAPGTGARAAVAGETGATTSPSTGYNTAPAATSSQPVYVDQPVYVQQPVYVPAPVYAPAPIYAPAPAYAPDPYYWWAPISIGLGFNWSHFSGGHHGWGDRGWGGHGGGGRGWGGHGGGGRSWGGRGGGTGHH